MSVHTFDMRADFQWLPDETAVPCPKCGGEAHFTSADVIVPTNAADKHFRASGLRRMRFAKAERHYSKWFRNHYLSYKHVGDREPEVESYRAFGWGPGTCLYGTAICTRCGAHEKCKLNWPDDAYFQLSFSGRRLWFYNRDHVVGTLELLTDTTGKPIRLPNGIWVKSLWSHWFNNTLPTVFKTQKARKILPAKLKRMLRS